MMLLCRYVSFFFLLTPHFRQELMTSEIVLTARITRFTHELRDTCHTLVSSGIPIDEDAEHDVLHRLRRLLSLRVRLAEHSHHRQSAGPSTLENDVIDVVAAAPALHDTVCYALEHIFHIPPSDIETLLIAGAPDLGLLQWDPWSAPKFRLTNSQETNSQEAKLWIRTRTSSLDRPPLDMASLPPLIHIALTVPSQTDVSAAPNQSQPAPSLTAQATTNKKDAIVEEVRRSIDALKSNAGRLHSQMSADDATLQSNEAMMDKALNKTTKQSSDLARVNNDDGRSSLSNVPGGRLLSKIPGVALLWGSILLPLWAVIRQAVMLLLVIAVTGATISMMLMVPRLYVRIVALA
jgi:hypothetical protein